jgi:hypothetical protein
MVGKLFQKENPIHINDGRKREIMVRYSGGKLLLYLFLRHPSRTVPAYREVYRITQVEDQNHQAAHEGA